MCHITEGAESVFWVQYHVFTPGVLVVSKQVKSIVSIVSGVVAVSILKQAASHSYQQNQQGGAPLNLKGLPPIGMEQPVTWLRPSFVQVVQKKSKRNA